MDNIERLMTTATCCRVIYIDGVAVHVTDCPQNPVTAIRRTLDDDDRAGQ